MRIKPRQVLLAAIFFLALVLPSSAAAGTYQVTSCRTPAGGAGEAAPWYTTVQAGTAVSDGCDEARPFTAIASTGSLFPGARATWAFEAPPHTLITDVVLYRFARAVHGAGCGKGYELTRDAPNLDRAHMLEECVPWPPTMCGSVGDPGNPFSPKNRVERRVTAHRLLISAECIGPANCPATAGVGEVRVYQANVTLADDSRPSFTADTSGPLLRSGATLSGVQDAYYSAADAGGGLYRVGLAVDGVVGNEQPVAQAGGACAPRSTDAVPCPLFSSGDYVIDTRRLADGPHTLQLVTTDVAGNRSYGRVALVRVRNHATPNGFGATSEAVLRAGFDRGRSRSRTVAYGGRPAIAGRLTARGGRPIIGARLTVWGRPTLPGARLRVEGHVRTDLHGRFTYRVGRGSSRLLRVGYRAFDLDAATAARVDLRLGVRAGVTLAIHPRRVRNGGRIVFSGRLKGGPSRAGTLVTMQEIDPRPLTFQTLRVGRSGRFRGSYRFRYTYRPARFRFRALVQRQTGYPYLTGSSNVVSVSVRP